MKNYLYGYIDSIDNVLKKKDKKINYNLLRDSLLVKIQIFQQERLINLIIIMFYFVFTIMFMYISTIIPLFLIVAVLLLAFLIFYVINYSRIENGVHYLYKQYDKVLKCIDN